MKVFHIPNFQAQPLILLLKFFSKVVRFFAAIESIFFFVFFVGFLKKRGKFEKYIIMYFKALLWLVRAYRFEIWAEYLENCESDPTLQGVQASFV